MARWISGVAFFSAAVTLSFGFLAAGVGGGGGGGGLLCCGVAVVAVVCADVPVGVAWLVAALVVVAQYCFGCGLVVFNINAVSLRQGLTPDRLQGRINASVRLLVQGLTPLGALGGGLLGELLGLRTTLFIAIAGELAAVVWLLLSPIRCEREIALIDGDAA